MFGCDHRQAIGGLDERLELRDVGAWRIADHQPGSEVNRLRSPRRPTSLNRLSRAARSPR